jgi:hypothetical protein
LIGVDGISLGAAVGEELIDLCLSDESHCEVPCVCGPERSGHNHPDREGDAQENES